ncbi:MAG: NAD(P)/FAD-dependent oxidoreductase [Actinomycetota bacterium]|nr:NAD(P)/FAD-dependent oxidoreductase [Actinomycetota bacterium]
MKNEQDRPEKHVEAVVVEAVVVGAGFAGMYLVHRLASSGRTVRCFEAGSDVGGTWYWNRYPGARCDVDSMEYSYDFDDELQQEWEWTERYATQPEILRYAQHVADRFDLRRHITFHTRVERSVFDETLLRWTVTTDAGEVLTSRFVIMATGCLSSTNLPDIEGLDTFSGPLVHTGRWPHDGVDFAGKRVGIVGTGSSGIQAIPVIAQTAAHVTVFQRTAQFTIPAQNCPLDPEEQAAIKAEYGAFRERNRRMPGAFGDRYQRPAPNAVGLSPEAFHEEMEFLWQQGGPMFLSGFRDLMRNPAANQLAADFVRGKIAEIVHNPVVADRLTPTGMIGCKRLVVDTDYYATYNRPNVTLVDVSEHGQPITRITATGLQAGETHYEFDVLIFATGFDAMTGSLLRVDLRGRGGESLAETWAAGPVTYLGLGVTGFPNLFMVTGPGSPSVLANMIIATEQHVDWIMDCIHYMDSEGHAVIEAERHAVDDWVAHVNSVAGRTIFPSCSSWYLGANIPGKPRVFMPLPGFPAYVDRCQQIAANAYEGFRFESLIPTAS